MVSEIDTPLASSRTIFDNHVTVVLNVVEMVRNIMPARPADTAMPFILSSKSEDIDSLIISTNNCLISPGISQIPKTCNPNANNIENTRANSTPFIGYLRICSSQMHLRL